MICVVLHMSSRGRASHRDSLPVHSLGRFVGAEGNCRPGHVNHPHIFFLFLSLHVSKVYFSTTQPLFAQKFTICTSGLGVGLVLVWVPIKRNYSGILDNSVLLDLCGESVPFSQGLNMTRLHSVVNPSSTFVMKQNINKRPSLISKH